MLSLKKILIISAYSLPMLATLGHADEGYQFQITGAYENNDADTSEENRTALTADIYFKNVDTSHGPLSEAAFLDKSSFLTVAFIKNKVDIQNSAINTIDLDGPIFLINYVTDNNNIILGATYAKVDLETNDNLITGDRSLTAIYIGKYINDTSTLELAYSSLESELQNTASNQISKIDNDEFSLTYNTVQPLDNTSSYYHFGASIALNTRETTTKNQDNREFAVEGMYYFNRNTGLGASVANNSGDYISVEGNTIGIEVSHFFTPQIAVLAELTKFKAKDEQIEDIDSISIAATVRF